jgi:hypothetical protein
MGTIKPALSKATFQKRDMVISPPKPLSNRRTSQLPDAEGEIDGTFPVKHVRNSALSAILA